MSMTEPNDFSKNYKIGVEDMWAITKGDTGNWGIEGYDVPRQYFDCLKSKKSKEIWEQIASNKIKPGLWPPKLPKDSEEKLIWPKRPNFIDEKQKWANSFIDKAKMEKLVEEFSGKNKDWDKPPKKKEIAKALQTFNLQGDRKTNIDLIIHNEKKKTIPYPDKEEKINEMREKLEKEYKEKKTNIDKILEKYKTKGGLPKCERITVVADSEHMGEKIPFCTEGKKKEGESEGNEDKPKSKKFTYNTIYPNVIKK